VLCLAVDSILEATLIKIIWDNDDFVQGWSGSTSATTTLNIYFFWLEGYIEVEEFLVFRGQSRFLVGSQTTRCSASNRLLGSCGALIDGTALTAGIWWGRVRSPRPVKSRVIRFLF